MSVALTHCAPTKNISILFKVILDISGKLAKILWRARCKSRVLLIVTAGLFRRDGHSDTTTQLLDWSAGKKSAGPGGVVVSEPRFVCDALKS